MKSGSNWPRPEYLKPDIDNVALTLLAGNSQNERLLRLLHQQDCDRSAICVLLQSWKQSRPDWKEIVDVVSLTDEEIVAKWDANRVQAANSGNWMHAMFENALNGSVVSFSCPEFSMLCHFLNTCKDCKAYRTEWMIFSSEWNLAGSIDFVLQCSDGSLVLVDWKRSKDLRNKYKSFGKFMKPPFDNIPDTTGWHYRVQLNLYKAILEKSYHVLVSKMYVVCAHPDNHPVPFIDEVLDLQTEVHSALRLRCSMCQPLLSQCFDNCGAGLDDSQFTQKSDREDEIALTTAIEAAIPDAAQQSQTNQLEVLNQSQRLVADQQDDLELHNLVPEAAKRRRLMKGASTTLQVFHSMFQSFTSSSEAHLRDIETDRVNKDTTILCKCETLRQKVKDKHSDWPDLIVRLSSAALAVSNMRLTEKTYIGDSALLLWLLDGGVHIRVHSGFIYIYNENGAFLPYSGIPPEAVLHRVYTFFVYLEGLFKLLPSTTPRSEPAILDAISTCIDKYASIELFLSACNEASLQVAAAPVNPLDEASVADNNGSSHVWLHVVSKQVWKVCQSIRSELMYDKLMALLVEWCETPHPQKEAVCFNDTCVVYDINGQNLTHFQKSPENNCYVHISHPLKDPVLKTCMDRLQKFYRETFWCNQDVFQCNMAAIALAKRGLNVDRCFIGQSPGGVGQSLYSTHLASMFGHNHGFFDPNIWYNEDELRKQVESFARCFIITGQEAPESTKKMHMDLFKKMMSADGVAGRKPYGYTTRMFYITGWKRLEVNRMLVFGGVSENNFNSVMRRALVWKAKARFVSGQFLRKEYPDHAEDGFFECDPSLKNFLQSDQASAAGLVLQHGFELEHNKQACQDMIENYATLGGDDYLTEDTMRIACNLKARVRHTESVVAALPVALAVASGEEAVDDSDSYQKLFLQVFAELLSSRKAEISFQEFKKMLLLDGAPNMSKDVLWSELLARNLMRKGDRRHKVPLTLMPHLVCERKLEEVVQNLHQVECARSLPETFDMIRFKNYLHCHESRANNLEVMKTFFKQVQNEKNPKAGKPALQLSSRKQFAAAALAKLASHELACARITEEIEYRGASVACTPTKRARKKATVDGEDPTQSRKLLGHQTTYKMPDSCEIRSRRFVVGAGAQSCSRRLQQVLISHTSDLDIVNSQFVIIIQLLDKLKPCPSLPDDLRCVLDMCAYRRSDVAATLNLTNAETKKLMHTILSGGSVPRQYESCQLLQDIQKVSMYVRWMAASVLPNLYESLLQNPDKSFPSASILYCMYAATEDFILESWVDYILEMTPSHLSLHFDGVRINNDIVPDLHDFMNRSEQEIQARTGFKIQVREKHHHHFIGLLDLKEHDVLECVPESLLLDGNCIFCSTWHLLAQQQKLQQAIVSRVQISSSRASKSQFFSYQDVSKALASNLIPSIGAPTDFKKPFLLHSENNGRPHCVAVQNYDNQRVQVRDGKRCYTMKHEEFRAALHDATDNHTFVHFTIQEPGDADCSALETWMDCSIKLLDVLLDLQAGALKNVLKRPACVRSQSKVVSATLSAPSSSSQSTSSRSDSDSDRKPEFSWEQTDDDETVVAGNRLLEAMREEVKSFLKSLQKKKYPEPSQYKCQLCPWRTFIGSHSKARLRTHVQKHHVLKNQFCPSGHKQLKVVMALHDSYVMKNIELTDLLAKSAEHLKQTVLPGLDPNQTLIDRELRLVLAAEGPRYVNVSAVSQPLSCRRVRNIYYTQSFAEVIYKEMLMHNSNVRAMLPRLHLRCEEANNALGSLFLSQVQFWWPIIEDVFSSPCVQEKEAQILQNFVSNDEFMYVSVDATLKTCLSILGQQSYRASARVRADAAYSQENSIRRVLTVRGRTGAVLAIKAIETESAEAVSSCFQKSFKSEWLSQVKYVACDNASRKYFSSLKEVCLNLKGMCLDPIHLAIVYEYATWRCFSAL